MSQDQKDVPTDTTAGGAAKIANLKSFKAPKDINVLRVSPTIARQELLSYFRMINRDCFSGSLADPFIHMEHSGDINTPMKFVPDERRAKFSISKAKLMGLTIPQMWPELLEMTALYWMFEEGLSPDRNTEQFREKLKYIQDAANPKFVRERNENAMDGDSDTTTRADARSASQAFADKYLAELPNEKLELFLLKNKDMTTQQRADRRAVCDFINNEHTKALKNLHKKQHFVAPSNGMIQRRAEMLLQQRGLIASHDDAALPDEDGH